MVIKMINKFVRMRRFQSGLRRGLAAALSVALVLPMLAFTTTFAADSKLFPVKAATPDEFPHIEVEGNFVRDEFGFLTGYYELGLRVKTPENGSFMGLGVVLEYDTSILTPVDWSETGANVTISNTGYYNVQMPTQKLASISSATAHSGIPAVSAGDTTTADSTKALMSFVVNSYKQIEFPGNPVEPDATTLAAVRFRVNKKVMENVSISKTSTGAYEVKYGDEKVTDVDSLFNRMQLVSPDVAVQIMGFAPDADIKKSGDESKKLDVHMALDYMAGYETAGGKVYTNEYYHIPDYDPDNATTYETGTDAVETIEGKTHAFDIRPKTENNRIMAIDPDCPNPDTATTWGAGKYSYTSNLIVNKYADYIQNPENYITFPIVSKRSFIDQADTLGKLTTIVYVDWDNTLLGTQVVPKNVDVRQLVSDHVAENFIYHDSDNTTYGSNDLNSPLEVADPEAAVSSLERKDNYRGKYTANGPAAESVTDSTVVADGASYPLTNKLDYVFLKRPMTHTEAFDEAANPKPDPDDHTKYPGGVTDPDYISDLNDYNTAYNTWFWSKTEWSQQTDDEGNAVWDTERPYAYGWAECTVDNYEDVWTTLGMGELGSTAAVTEANAKGTTKGYSGASIGGYKAIPSTSVASVTYDGDADFAFADLSKGFNKSMVFLKAVYEPGEDLLDRSYNYRMTHKPYYNKFNNKSANAGGAYSILVAYERATEEVGNTLRGVARIREPVVRQDTTTDLKWEESVTPLVSHNLTNATWDEAYSDKGKTTYTKVDVPNSEEITLEMAFSARQNKVDLFLSENYEANFVVAGGRTITNALRDFEEYAADNYNYYTGDTGKVPTDYFAAKDYSDREGTYGFVLFGTLNYLMEQSTGYAHGTVDTNDFYNTVGDTLADANVMKSDGSPITSIDYTAVTDAMEELKKAALAAEAHKNAADAADYWNAERDCAELTYHQLQLYIKGQGLLSRTAADAEKISWCHLHTDCNALLSGKPQDWPTLIAKAAAGDHTSIEKLTIQEIESKFHLRSDGDGNASWTAPTPYDFSAIMVAGVQALIGMGIAQTDITWDQVQYYIDKGAVGASASDMNDYGAENYWWYDGKKVENFEDVKLAADAAHATPNVAQTLPDDRPVAERKAKLNQLQSAFPTDADNPSEDWIKFTENLTMGEDSSDPSKVVAFDDFDDFVTKLVDAVNVTGTAADWTTVQAEILGDTTSDPNYWWHNGGVNITDLRTLLKAAKKGGDTWANVDFNAYNGLNLKLAADLKGTAIDNSNYSTIKGYLYTYANTPGLNLDAITDDDLWDTVQSLIINKGAVDDAKRDAEKGYYWWKDGSATPSDAISFTPTGSNNEAKAKSMAKLLSEAYFKIKFNGYLITEWNNLTETDLATGRLVKSFTGSETNFSALGQLTTADVATVIAKMDTLFAAVNGGAGNLAYYPTPIYTQPFTPIDWTALQAAILGDTTPNPEYWWMKDDTKANAPQDDFADLQTALANYVAARTAANLQALKDAFTPAKVSNMGFVRASQPTRVDMPEATINNINTRWAAIVSASAAQLTGPVTWDQIEYLCLMALSNQFRIYPAAQSTAQVTVKQIDRPSWVASATSIMPMMAMMSMLSPERKLEQQAAEAKELAEALSVAVGDPALAAKLLEDEDFMANFAVIAEAMGYTSKEKTEEKAPEKEPEKESTYKLEKDTGIYEIDTKKQEEQKQEEQKQEEQKQEEQKQEEQKQEEQKQEEQKQEEQKQEEQKQEDQKQEGQKQEEREETIPAAAEDKETLEIKTTTVDNIEEDEIEEELTTDVNNQIPETGQGDGSILDTSQAGVDPPPDEGLPQIIGIIILERFEKSTEGVHVA